MGKNIVQKILETHLVEGELTPGKTIAIKIDQTLTQDATGTLAYLQFQSIGIPRVKTDLSVSYVDHNTLQTGFENADDHLYLQTVAAKYGIFYAKAGTGICHQVHLERFSAPGKTLLGSDSHTPTAGGACMLAIGAGGLDVASAMAGYPFYLTMPRIVKVELIGRRKDWVSAKDIILELLRRLTVKGGVGKIFEYQGEGVKSLSVPERATITNMGAELGATTSIFPSDEITKEYFKAQRRLRSYTPLLADADADYDETISIDLSELEPLIAQPHSPDNVVKVKDIQGIKVNQVLIGSCTNSSYVDLMKVASILDGKKVHPDVSLGISPGSKQVLTMIAKNGALAKIIQAGARILEATCGPCIGMGQAPSSGAVSLRSFNRNFEGRSGTIDAKVYLASAEVCAISAIKGEITDPRVLGEEIKIRLPKSYLIDDSSIIPPPENPEKVEVKMGPNIKPIPKFTPAEDIIEGKVILKVGDNISTDHILPAGAKILPLRSNLPAISEYTFSVIDKSFAERAKATKNGIIVGASNYGQGSSREHAAMAPRYLGIRAIIVKSFARIHLANLINFGILPLIFTNPDDYENINQDDVIRIEGIVEKLKSAASDTIDFEVINKSRSNAVIHCKANLSKRQREIILAGGLLNYLAK